MKNSTKLLTVIFAAMIIFTLLVMPVSAATSYPETINVPDSTATIDGVIEAGEWDDATPILMKLSDLIADQDSGVPGAGLVGGPKPDVINDDDIWISVRIKVKEGYLYVLEERKDSTLQFTNDDPITSYASDGSIIFFVEKVTSTFKELSIIADTKSKTGPAFALNESTPINAEEAKAVITSNSFVLEAKFKLSALELTEEGFRNGDYLITYCAANIIEPNFSGSSADLWGTNYQLQYKGIGPWGDSVPLKVIAGAVWPPAAPEITEAPVAAAVQEQVPVADTGVSAAAAPKTGDIFIIFIILAILSSCAFITAKRFVKIK